MSLTDHMHGILLNHIKDNLPDIPGISYDILYEFGKITIKSTAVIFASIQITNDYLEFMRLTNCRRHVKSDRVLLSDPDLIYNLLSLLESEYNYWRTLIDDPPYPHPSYEC